MNSETFIEIENIWHFDYDDFKLIGKKFIVTSYNDSFIKKIEELLFKVDSETDTINPNRNL